MPRLTVSQHFSLLKDVNMKKIFFLCGVLVMMGILGCKKKPLSGFVKNSFGKDLSGVKVTIMEDSSFVKTDKRGRFAMAFTPGKVTLQFSKQGYSPIVVKLHLPTKKNYIVRPVVMFSIAEKRVYSKYTLPHSYNDIQMLELLPTQIRRTLVDHAQQKQLLQKIRRILPRSFYRLSRNGKKLLLHRLFTMLRETRGTNTLRRLAAQTIKFYAMQLQKKKNSSSSFPATGWNWVCAPKLLPCAEGHGASYPPRRGIWQLEPWRSLRFRITKPHYYQYCYRAKGKGLSARFQIIARADFHCTKKYSAFSISGSVDRQSKRAKYSAVVRFPEKSKR